MTNLGHQVSRAHCTNVCQRPSCATVLIHVKKYVLSNEAEIIHKILALLRAGLFLSSKVTFTRKHSPLCTGLRVGGNNILYTEKITNRNATPGIKRFRKFFQKCLLSQQVLAKLTGNGRSNAEQFQLKVIAACMLKYKVC